MAFLTDKEIKEVVDWAGLNAQKVQDYIDNSLTLGLTADDVVSMDQDVWDNLFRLGGLVGFQSGGTAKKQIMSVNRAVGGPVDLGTLIGTKIEEQQKYMEQIGGMTGAMIADRPDSSAGDFGSIIGTQIKKQQKYMEQIGGMTGDALRVPAYGRGSKFIPSNQLAYLHGGEAVIPASMNIGGMAKQYYQGGGAVEKMGIDEEAITNAIKAGIEAATVKAELQDNVVRLEDNRVELDPAAFTGLKESINTAVGTGISNVDGRVANLEGQARGWTEATKNHEEQISKLKFEDLPALKIETKSLVHDKTEVLRTEMKNSNAEVGAELSIYNSRITAQEREVTLAKSDINATKGELSNVNSKADRALTDLSRRS